MDLRELTEKEKKELEKIKVTCQENGYKILIAIVAIDLMGDSVYGKTLQYKELIRYIDNGKYHNGEGFVLVHILETWILKMARKNNIVIDKNMDKTIMSLVVCFIYTICGISPGISGKKYTDMVKLYNKIKDMVQREKGDYIENCPEENYRYIVTCLEYMGLKREPREIERVIDASEIVYDDLFN